jgi:prepilin-type N-terminal cleavage/methylation domain-containing protein/prepilin-type processing-associated H-X9-DG protein
MKLPERPRGFTLIELLVVMSIISLLMSILMPSLSRARNAGKRVVCGSNLRQFCFCWHLYAMDNDDRICSPDTLWNNVQSGQGTDHWVADGPCADTPALNPIGGTEQAIKDGVLYHYTESVKLYKCKADPSKRLRSYAITLLMGSQASGAVSNLSSVKGSSEKAVFVDASSKFDWIDGGFWPFTADTTNQRMLWRRLPEQYISARHDEGFNLSFADGHVEYWKYKDQRTVDMANWTIEPAAADNGNADLDKLFNALNPLSLK